MLSVLLVDDDHQICQLLTEYLSKFGMSVIAVADGKLMAEALEKNTFDIIILDLMLPGEDGLALCRRLRETSNIPILMLTARGEIDDRIHGLELGADGYIVKPFEPRELVARIQSVLRRIKEGRENTKAPSLNEIVSFKDWRLNCVLRQLISSDNLVVPLSNAEYRLLKVFIKYPGRVLSRDILLEKARGRDMDVFDRSIDLLVSRLRQKLGDNPRTPSLIKTVHGEGYLFDLE